MKTATSTYKKITCVKCKLLSFLKNIYVAEIFFLQERELSVLKSQVYCTFNHRCAKRPIKVRTVSTVINVVLADMQVTEIIKWEKKYSLSKYVTDKANELQVWSRLSFLIISSDLTVLMIYLNNIPGVQLLQMWCALSSTPNLVLKCNIETLYFGISIQFLIILLSPAF